MKEEVIYIVDENDKFIRKSTRKEVRENSLLHRAARVIITNREGGFLIQKRSLGKDIHPGLWDIGIAETVIDGNSYESTAIRGLMEELGVIGISNIQLMHSVLFKLKYFSPNHNILCKVYSLAYNGRIELQAEEIDEAKFATPEEIKILIEKRQFSPVGKVAFEKFLELSPKPSNKYQTITINQN